MTDLPTTPDREQQKADNVASRRQSGLDPLPKDRDEESAGERDRERDRESPDGDTSSPDSPGRTDR